MQQAAMSLGAGAVHDVNSSGTGEESDSCEGATPGCREQMAMPGGISAHAGLAAIDEEVSTRCSRNAPAALAHVPAGGPAAVVR